MTDGAEILSLTCPACGRRFHLNEGTALCPYCREPLTGIKADHAAMERDDDELYGMDISENIGSVATIDAQGDIKDSIFHRDKVIRADSEEETGEVNERPSLRAPEHFKIAAQGCRAVIRWEPVDRVERQGPSVRIGDNVFHNVNISVMQAADVQLEYEISRKEEGDDEWEPVGSTNKLRIEDPEVICGVQYSYRIRAVQGTVESEFTDERTFSFKPKNLGKPEVAREPGGAVRISLKKPRRISHMIERKGPGDERYFVIATVKGTDYVDGDIARGGVYLYRVACTCENAVGDFSEPASITIRVTDPDVHYEYAFDLVNEHKPGERLRVLATPVLRLGRGDSNGGVSTRDDGLRNHVAVSRYNRYSRQQAEIIHRDNHFILDQSEHPLRGEIHGQQSEATLILRAPVALSFPKGGNKYATSLNLRPGTDEADRPWLMLSIVGEQTIVDHLLYLPGSAAVSPVQAFANIATDDAPVFHYDPDSETMTVEIDGQDVQLRNGLEIPSAGNVWKVADFCRLKYRRTGMTKWKEPAYRCRKDNGI